MRDIDFMPCLIRQSCGISPDFSQLDLRPRNPAKSRGISPDTQPTRPLAELAKIRRYSARLSRIMLLLFNKAQFSTFIGKKSWKNYLFSPRHTKLRISHGVAKTRVKGKGRG